MLVHYESKDKSKEEGQQTDDPSTRAGGGRTRLLKRFGGEAPSG